MPARRHPAYLLPLPYRYLELQPQLSQDLADDDFGPNSELLQTRFDDLDCTGLGAGGDVSPIGNYHGNPKRFVGIGDGDFDRAQRTNVYSALTVCPNQR